MREKQRGKLRHALDDVQDRAREQGRSQPESYGEQCLTTFAPQALWCDAARTAAARRVDQHSTEQMNEQIGQLELEDLFPM
ncbi:MAG: hypothetical protein R3F45_04940 [Gammaproteobacteria bacterium]